MSFRGVQAESTGRTDAPEWTLDARDLLRAPHLPAKVFPFALIVLVAEVSLAFPPGVHSQTDALLSVGLLLATGGAFALPFRRLPTWTAVIIPLTYTGSLLALSLAGGPNSGVGVVLLVPPVWTALFHRKLDTAIVVIGVVGAEVVVSVAESASFGVTMRRAILWSLLASVVAVAIQGLRERTYRSAREREESQQHLGELSLLQERARIATELQSQVIKRVFDATLSLRSAARLTSSDAAQERIAAAVEQLDLSIRLLRETVFGAAEPRGEPSAVTPAPPTPSVADASKDGPVQLQAAE